MPNVICKVCSQGFHIPPSWIKRKRGFYCSQKCYGISKKGMIPWNKNKKTGLIPKTAFKKGHKPAHYKGWQKSTQGYILIHKPNHPFCDCRGYVLRSRLVMEKYLGRYLKPEEIVHYRGVKYPISSIKNRQDDRIKNLELFINKSEHTKFHMILRYKSKTTQQEK